MAMKVLSAEGISPEGIIQKCFAPLWHFHLLEVCLWANPPDLLRTAPASCYSHALVMNLGFVDFADFACEQGSNEQVWYREENQTQIDDGKPFTPDD